MVTQEEYNDLRNHWEFENGPKELGCEVVWVVILILLGMVVGGFIGASITKSYYNTFVADNPELQSIQIEQAEKQLRDIERKIDNLKKTNAERDQQQ